MQKLAEINVIAELDRYGIPFEPANETHVKCRCPFHDDQHPSLSVNTNTGGYKCHAASCGKKGHIIGLLAAHAKREPAHIRLELSTRYDLDHEEKTIAPGLVEQYHNKVWNSGPLLQALRDRTLTDDDIRKHRLGFDGKRITIPIFNARGQCVNMRRYLPGAPQNEKMKNERGYSRKRLFPFDQLQHDQIVVTGGELKAIAGSRVLNPHGIGCITVTGAEGAWDQAFGPLFKDKRVVLCMDTDEGGRVGTSKVGAALVNYARDVRDLHLPLDAGEFPHGDINDYLREHGDSAFVGLVLNAPSWKPIIRYGRRYDKNEEPVELALADAMHAENVGRRVKFRAVISAMHTSPFAVPKETEVICPRDQAYCGLCPIRSTKVGTLQEIQDEHAAVLKMVGHTDHQQHEALKTALGIPSVCKCCDFNHKAYYNTEDVKLSSELDVTDRTTERSMQPAVVHGRYLEMNETYEMVGRLHPDPKSQQATLVVSEAKLAQDALSTFNTEDLTHLKVFQPAGWSVEHIEQKLVEIYHDLTANITRVYQRDDMHLVVDLIYHSPLLVKFDGRVEKGWAECLIIGDSSQGKSAVLKYLSEHYQLGVKVDCKNASVAGLHGGLQQISGKWYVTWGIIPMHDRRLVILEEIKGASEELLARLTDMRSSGRAEIYKIEKRSTHARTRLIAVSNPRSDLPMRAYNYGVEAVRELLGSLEDVRRFDVVMAVAANEIDSAELNKLSTLRPQVQHTYTSELCRTLVLWGWTRLENQIIFDGDAESEVLQVAIRMCDKYTDDIPIVDRGSQRLKIARLAAALAVRTFSYDTENNDYSTIRVRLGHVLFIEKFLNQLYTKPSLGYAAYSDSVKIQQVVSRPDDVKSMILALPCRADFVTLMLNAGAIDTEDLQNWGNMPKEVAHDLVSLLVRTNALMRRGKFFRKSPAFTEMLRELAALPDGPAAQYQTAEKEY